MPNPTLPKLHVEGTDEVASVSLVLRDALDETRSLNAILASVVNGGPDAIARSGTAAALESERWRIRDHLAQLSERVARMRLLAQGCGSELQPVVLERLREVSTRLLEAQWLARQASSRARLASLAVDDIDRAGAELEATAVRLRRLSLRADRLLRRGAAA